MRRHAADCIAVIVLIAAVLAFDGQLLGHRIPRGEDHWLAFLPAYRIGESGWPPRWNPYVCGGAPFVANPQYSAWYPPRWIFASVAALDGYGPFCFGHFLAAALAMFLCLRGLGCGPTGALVGSVGFACGSYIQGHLSNPGLLFSSVWLPLIVPCSFRAMERAGVRWPMLLGLLMAVIVFAGSPHNIFYAALIVALAAIWHVCFGTATDSTASSKVARTIGHLGLAAAIALGVSAIQWIPTVEFARLSFRQSLSVSDLARDPLAWSWLDNLFVGTPAPWATEYLDKSAYFAMSALPLLLAAIMVARKPRREWFFVALAAVGVWIALGTQAGAFQLFGFFPALRFLSGPSRALVLFALGMSALVGMGADNVARIIEERRARKSFWLVVSACAAAALVLFLTRCRDLSWQDARDIALRATTPRDPSLFLTLNASVFLALGALLVGAARILPARFQARHWLGPALVLLVFLDLFHFRQRLPLPMASREGLAAPETVAAVLRDQTGPFRVVGYEPTRVNPGDMNDCSLRELLMPNLAALYGLHDIQGFDPLILRDYARLVEATAGRSPIDDPVRMLNVARPDATLFRLLNVRYLIGDVRERRLAAWPTEQDGVFTMALDKPTTITGVSLVSLLNFAEDLSDGAVVGVVIACGDEATQTAVIRAGMETSDWRVADSRFPCRHKPARKNMEWTVATRAGDVQVANYYAQVAFAKPVVARAIEIRRALPNTVLSIATVGIILPEPPGWEKVYERDRYRVYRNHDCLGGAWLVHRVREVGSEDEALSLLAKDAVDLSHEAVVSKPFKLGVLPETEDGAAASHDEVAFVRYEADKIEIRTTSSQPAMLCLAEVHYPGWRAELDGQPTELLRVNFLLRGVVIPAAGAHVVTLRFAPLSLAIGKVVSLVGVLVLVGLWIGSRTGRTGQTGPTGPTRL